MRYERDLSEVICQTSVLASYAYLLQVRGCRYFGKTFHKKKKKKMKIVAGLFWHRADS